MHVNRKTWEKEYLDFPYLISTAVSGCMLYLVPIIRKEKSELQTETSKLLLTVHCPLNHRRKGPEGTSGDYLI